MLRWVEMSVYSPPAAGRPPPPFIGQGEAVTSIPHSKMYIGCVMVSSAPGG
jgi:hypothetical protein